MIIAYKLEDEEYNKFILYNKDPNIGKTIYLDKNLTDEESIKRLSKFYNEKVKLWE